MFCQNCGKENLNNSNYCYSCGIPLRNNIVAQGSSFAGFWLRVGAFLIDYLIFSALYSVLNIFVKEKNQNVAALELFFFIIATWLYNSLMESSKYQGSIGKKICKIKVLDKNGNKISFGRATIRHFSKITIVLTFYIGIIMIAFTKKKQSLHDIIAGCVVVNSQQKEINNSSATTEKDINTEVKTIIEKKVACEELINKIMIDRIVTKKSSLTEEDNKRMESEVLELYKVLMNSPKKLRESTISNVFAMENSSFNFDSLLNLMKLTVYIKLNEEGKIQS